MIIKTSLLFCNAFVEDIFENFQYAKKVRETFSQKQFWLFIIVALFPWLMHGFDWPDIIIKHVDHCPQLGCDFTRHYFPQMEFMSQNARIFQTGWFYPPLLAILLQPLLWASKPLAVWTGLQLLLMLGLTQLLAKRIVMRNTIQSGLCALVIVTTSFPVLHSVKWGQISLFIAVGLIFVFYEWRERKYVGPALLGLLGGLKIYPIYFLLLYLLEKKARLFLIALGAFIFFALVFPLLIIGPEATQQYYLRVQGGILAVKMMASSAGGQSVGVSAFRWFQDAVHVNSQNPVDGALLIDSQLLYILFLFGSPLLIFGLIFTAWKKNFSGERITALIIVGVHLLISPGWHHYFAFFPFVWLISWKEAGKLGKFVLLGVFLLERLPMFTLGTMHDAYHWYSVSGMTTIVGLSMFFVLRFSEKSDTLIRENV